MTRRCTTIGSCRRRPCWLKAGQYLSSDVHVNIILSLRAVHRCAQSDYQRVFDLAHEVGDHSAPRHVMFRDHSRTSGSDGRRRACSRGGGLRRRLASRSAHRPVIVGRPRRSSARARHARAARASRLFARAMSSLVARRWSRGVRGCGSSRLDPDEELCVSEETARGGVLR